MRFFEKLLVVLLMVLVGVITPADTISGTVTDSVTNLPIDSVTVTAGDRLTLTNSQGKFSLVINTSNINNQVKKSNKIFLLNGRFSGFSASTSVKVLNARGAILWQGIGENLFLPNTLPSGMCFLRVNDRNVYKLVNINGRASCQFILQEEQTNEPVAIASAAITKIDFKKTGYTTVVKTVSGGSQSLLVALPPTGTIVNGDITLDSVGVVNVKVIIPK